jgi:pimeloyl-ACP methyl ester carboxylesterase
VVTVDLRGHGDSPRFTEAQLADWPAEVMVTDVIEVLDALVSEGNARTAIVGHSMGGGVAAGVAVARPDLVAALVLEDPALGADVSADESEALQWGAEQRAYLEAFHAYPEQGLRDGLAANARWPHDEIAAWAQAKLDTDLALAATGRVRPRRPWPQVVAELSVPALVVTGTVDVLWVGEDLQRLREDGSPSVRVEVIPGADHCVRRSSTRAFHALVDPWIAAHV